METGTKVYLITVELPEGKRMTVGRKVWDHTWEIAYFPDDDYPAESMEVEESCIEMIMEL